MALLEVQEKKKKLIIHAEDQDDFDQVITKLQSINFNSHEPPEPSEIEDPEEIMAKSVSINKT